MPTSKSCVQFGFEFKGCSCVPVINDFVSSLAINNYTGQFLTNYHWDN